jgi:acetyl-CoA C-acetyltransferase
VGQSALDLAGLTIDEVSMLDLYSCFPVAVQLAQRELGISAERPFTITGGLTFAGGPLNSYCLHALARSVELLRGSDGETAMLTGNGGFFTKHSCTILGSDPSGSAFAVAHPQDQVDALPSRPMPGAADTGTIETYTVTYGRDGFDRAIVAVIDDAGARHLTNSRDLELIETLLTNDMCETPARIDQSTEVPTVYV